jgi:hypothetical protein
VKPTKRDAAGVTQRRAQRLLGLVLLLLGCVLPRVCRAETDSQKPPTDAPELRRELAGHNFIPSKFSLDPFVSTYASSETGFGYGSAAGHTFDINGNPLTTADYQVAAFAQFLDFQYGFVDWWAVRLSVRILVYSGINAPGLAGVGSTLSGNPSLGTTVSFKVGEQLRLGGSLDLSFGPAVFFNIVQAVSESIKNCTPPGSTGCEIASPVNSFSQFTLKPAFVGAWAIDKAVGMTFSLSYQYTNASSANNAISANILSPNVTFDFDMSALNWVPIGLLGGVATEFSVGDVRFRSFRYDFGIYYTGVKPLNVGFEFVYNRAPIVGNTEVFLSSLIGLIILQYNFN